VIIFPFYGQKLFFGVIAFLAARNHVATDGFSAAGNRYDMIHGEPPRRESTAAIMAHAFGKAAFPPLALPQFPGLAAFAFEIGFIQWIRKLL
jgi:hypothetical protein